MKVIFIASLYEKEIYQFHYLAIINLLKGLGHSVVYNHIIDFEIKQLTNSQSDNIKFHNKILRTIKSADLVVVEVTRQSVGVGYCISEALKANKPVLTLTSAEIPPITNFLEEHQLLLVHRYNNIRELEKELSFLISQIEPKKDKKFNMFLSPELDDYLFNSATKKRLSKAEYIRQLLERDQQQPL